MSNSIPAIPASVFRPAKAEPKPQTLPAHAAAPKFDLKPALPVADPRQPEHHHSASTSADSTALSPTPLSSTDISYVQSLMGVLPAQKMEQILLRTGVPVPVNLGPNFDSTA